MPSDRRAGVTVADRHGREALLPGPLAQLVTDWGIVCGCGPEYSERGLIAPDCDYHDFMGALIDLLSLPTDQRMEAMGMEPHPTMLTGSRRPLWREKR